MNALVDLYCDVILLKVLMELVKI